MRPMKAAFSLSAFCLACAVATGAVAQAEPRMVSPATLTVAPSPPSPEYQAAMTRWQSSLAAFANADKENLPGTDGVLFVGSSTIRFWTHLAQDFRQSPVVINRGFGGSTMADCSLLARDAGGALQAARRCWSTPATTTWPRAARRCRCWTSFARFADAVRAALPDTRISYISIKPSPLARGAAAADARDQRT